MCNGERRPLSDVERASGRKRQTVVVVPLSTRERDAVVRRREERAHRAEARSSSTSATRVVHVRGYVRSNGTVVESYTRAATRTSVVTTLTSLMTTTNSSSSDASRVVHVSGYVRSNGTVVETYTRAAPRSSVSSTSSSSSSSSYATNCTTASPSSGSDARGSVDVHGYTRSDGTVVAAYSRSAPSSSASSGVGSSSSNSGGGGSYVSSYTRSNGTQVAGYYRGGK